VEPNTRQTFEARLRTLSNAHLTLTAENWRGVTLRELILSTLEPVMVEQSHYSAAGPRLRVQPKSAVALSMAIHELCTNAIKYGAQSVAGGRVAIVWDIDDRFRSRWQERGGPAVSAPERKGFGSLRIERASLAVQVDGEVQNRLCRRRRRLHHRCALGRRGRGGCGLIVLCPRAEASKRGALRWRPASEDAFEAGR
jgi:two-component sensor histidine kinase